MYYARRIVKEGERTGSYFAINSTKTPASKRIVPMLESVREAFEMERQYQEDAESECTARVDGYTDFVFVNRFGNVQHEGTLNKAIKRIVRDHNLEAVDYNSTRRYGAPERPMLPAFSCHSLRRTFATWMCEKGVNVKVIQNVMGHTDIGTTMNIYTVATVDMKTQAFKEFERALKSTDTVQDLQGNPADPS